MSLKGLENIYATREKRFLHGGDYFPEQWLHLPEYLQEDIKLMQIANTNTFSIGMFAWSRLEPEEGVYDFEWLDEVIDRIHSFGGNVILATPSGAKPSWMAKKYPEIRRVNNRREQELQGRRHNHCFTAPIYREKIKMINRKLAERYQNHPAILMWHISNEYSGECHCNLCQEAFRLWVKNRYNNDLEAVNVAWWATFWSHRYSGWDEIESPSVLGEDAMHGLTLDWQRFVTDQTIDFYKEEITPLRELTPHIPITTNFMADTADLIPFQALDYSKFAEHVDLISWDAYPAWHSDTQTDKELAVKVGFIDDLYRSLKQQPFYIMESTPSLVNWHDVNKAKRPGMHLLSSLQHVAHGSDSVMYFQWRKSRGASEKFHGAVVDHDNSTENRVFKDVQEVGAYLNKLEEVVGTNRDAEVAFIYDWENQWALQTIQGYSSESLRYPQTAQEHYRRFWERDIPVDVLNVNQDFTDYKLVVIPMLYMMKATFMEKVEAYVKAGGTVVMTYISGVVNENDLVYEGGWHEKLENVFGLTVTETDTYYPSDENSLNFQGKDYVVKDYATLLEQKTGEVISTYGADFYQGTPAVMKNTYGDGNSYYIGARAESAFQNDFYDQLIQELAIIPPFEANHSENVSVQVRKGPDSAYIFVMNFGTDEETITFEDEVVDLITGEKVARKITLNGYGVRVFKKI